MFEETSRHELWLMNDIQAQLNSHVSFGCFSFVSKQIYLAVNYSLLKKNVFPPRGKGHCGRGE